MQLTPEEGRARPEKPRKVSKRPAKKADSPSSPARQAQAVAAELIEMTDAFCRQYLNEEYAEMCRKMAMTLARKRPSPIVQGRRGAWASGILRSVGSVNFLDDPHQRPYMKFSQIDRAFGVAESTGQAKARAIRAILDIRNFDVRWTLPSLMEQNPLVWLLKVNGLVMDIRDAPREAQQVAFEKGLIPYIPADRQEQGEAE